MPHIVVKCYPGRTEEQKKEAAEKITKVIEETFGSKASSISVVIQEVAPEDWKEQVWDTEIAPNAEALYKEPGYQM